MPDAITVGTPLRRTAAPSRAEAACAAPQGSTVSWLARSGNSARNSPAWGVRTAPRPPKRVAKALPLAGEDEQAVGIDQDGAEGGNAWITASMNSGREGLRPNPGPITAASAPPRTFGGPRAGSGLNS